MKKVGFSLNSHRNEEALAFGQKKKFISTFSYKK